MTKKIFSSGYALLIGVGRDLWQTTADAIRLKNLLTDPDRCAYPREHVELITDNDANRSGILETSGKSSRCNSYCLFFRSWH